MRGVFLDKSTVGEVNYSALNKVLDECAFYEITDSDTLHSNCADVEVVITNKVKFNEETLRAFPKLKLICLTATGTDNIDLEAAKKLRIAVCNVPAYSTNSVAQHTFALLLALLQSLPNYYEVVQAGEWQRRITFNILDFPVNELANKTLGIVGYGDIGQQVAKIAKAFQMQVLLANIPGRPPKEGRLALHQLLPKVDYLSLHCPLSNVTYDLIGEKELNLMKPTAFLINTSRGAVINEAALAAALQQGKIAGAGLDVLAQEPPQQDNPLLSLQHPRLIITPHIAWASAEARQRCINIVADNIQSFIEAGQLNRVV